MNTERKTKLINNLKIAQEALDLLPPWAFEKEAEYQKDIIDYTEEINAIEEAYQLEAGAKCKDCHDGMIWEGLGDTFITCLCCDGFWESCANCADEAKKITTSEIAISAARYNVEHATPENKKWAEKRLEQELQKTV